MWTHWTEQQTQRAMLFAINHLPNTEYFLHGHEVAKTLFSFTKEENELVVAAYLLQIPANTKIPLAKIGHDFGSRVVQLITRSTFSPASQTTRLTDWQKYLDELKKSPKDVVLLVGIDYLFALSEALLYKTEHGLNTEQSISNAKTMLLHFKKYWPKKLVRQYIKNLELLEV